MRKKETENTEYKKLNEGYKRMKQKHLLKVALHWWYKNKTCESNEQRINLQS
jgi:hypothetical protein